MRRRSPRPDSGVALVDLQLTPLNYHPSKEDFLGRDKLLPLHSSGYAVRLARSKNGLVGEPSTTETQPMDQLLQ